MSGMTAANLGRSLDAADVQRGLRELNPDIHFDLPNNLASASYLIDTPDREKLDKLRCGIYYHGLYVTVMDRPICPEFKVWELEDGLEEIPVSMADKYDDVVTTYLEILPSDPIYHACLLKAQQKHDKFTIDKNGRVFAWSYTIPVKQRGRILNVGWRHTFENLIAAQIPGITRKALEKRFNVDLTLVPVGPDAELAFTEE
jgi:hypothetical protein